MWRLIQADLEKSRFLNVGVYCIPSDELSVLLWKRGLIERELFPLAVWLSLEICLTQMDKETDKIRRLTNSSCKIKNIPSIAHLRIRGEKMVKSVPL